MLELAPDQKSLVSAIGNDSRMPLAVRRLAWLAVRASEGLDEERVAGAVGLSLDCTRYWLRVLGDNGAAFFDRFINGPNGGNDLVAAVSIDELRTARDFRQEEGEFVARTALKLFDSLGTFHRLGSHHRGMLETAAMLHGLGDSLVNSGEDGFFFSVLDPSIQTLPNDEKRVLAALLRSRSGRVDAAALRKSFGLRKRETERTLMLISLLRMAITLNSSQSQSTAISSMESSSLAVYLILRGPRAAEDGAVAEETSGLWRTLTGLPLRTLTSTRTRLPGDRHTLSLYRARLKSPGVQAGDSLGTAGRKTMRFLFSAMLRQEDRVYIGQDTEALHKMRVTTRRIRSSLRVFQEGFRKKELRPFVKRFRELGRDLGVLRDHDVLLDNLSEYSRSVTGEEERAMLQVIDYFKRKRLDALIVTREYLRSDRYLRFIRAFHKFVEDVEDLHEGEGVQRVSYAGPIQIYERVASVREQGEALDAASIDSLHQLRIRFKALRYTLDAYEDVLADSAQSIGPVLKAIQDHLGRLQDSRTACEMIDEYLAGATPEEGFVRTAVETYRLQRAGEQQALTSHFRDLWDGFDNPQMRTNLALAIARF